jgi:hypothetical protein
MANADEYEKALTKLEMGVTLTDKEKELVKKMLNESGSRGNRARRAMN